jgi:hypothetical protein
MSKRRQNESGGFQKGIGDYLDVVGENSTVSWLEAQLLVSETWMCQCR